MDIRIKAETSKTHSTLINTKEEAKIKKKIKKSATT